MKDDVGRVSAEHQLARCTHSPCAWQLPPCVPSLSDSEHEEERSLSKL